MPTVPLLNAKPPAGARNYVKGSSVWEPDRDLSSSGSTSSRPAPQTRRPLVSLRSVHGLDFGHAALRIRTRHNWPLRLGVLEDNLASHRQVIEAARKGPAAGLLVFPELGPDGLSTARPRGRGRDAGGRPTPASGSPPTPRTCRSSSPSWKRPPTTGSSSARPWLEDGAVRFIQPQAVPAHLRSVR